MNNEWEIVKVRLSPVNKAELFDLKYAKNFKRLDDVISMLLRDYKASNIEILPEPSKQRRESLQQTFSKQICQ